MGLEQRNGNTYYTRSIRVNGKIKREYVGKGELALEAYHYDKLEQLNKKLEQERERDQWQQECDLATALDQTVTSVCTEASEAFCMVMEAAGYHQHARGQWRKKRKEKADEHEPIGNTVNQECRTRE